MKVAIIHDWLTGMRGGERCLEVFCELFPAADIYTLLYIKGKLSPVIEKMKIHSSFIQRLPFAKTKYRHYLPLFPYAVESFDLNEYDLVISSSHCIALGALTNPASCHICYCYTPMRYVWDMYSCYFGPSRIKGFKRMLIDFNINWLRIWDVTASFRVDYFASISNHVARRIFKYYRREAQVIYPPVNTEFFKPVDEDEDFYLVVSALAPYKKIDIAIEAFNELGYPLMLIGDGQEEKKLKKMAKKNIKFLGWQPDNTLKNYYARCKAFIFPQEEDFGITPLEAQSAGRPVIAFGKGGALETVIEDETGVFFTEQTTKGLIDAVKRFERMSFNKEKIRANALRFNNGRFREEIRNFINERLAHHSQRMNSLRRLR